MELFCRGSRGALPELGRMCFESDERGRESIEVLRIGGRRDVEVLRRASASVHLRGDSTDDEVVDAMLGERPEQLS
jgi:hypothetical protein